MFIIAGVTFSQSFGPLTTSQTTTTISQTTSTVSHITETITTTGTNGQVTTQTVTTKECIPTVYKLCTQPLSFLGGSNLTNTSYLAISIVFFAIASIALALGARKYE